ncbi:MAG TPA: peptidoglycan-binding protein, partial [Cellvibrio sp.]|nr:peptidoglycan-binding protein [Cellvibrio sp.]
MTHGITKSVGNNGANERNDVTFIQSCLNGHAKFYKSSIVPLKVDGLCQSKTIEAIKIFQKDYVAMRNPDGRVDPNGKTLRYLTMYLAKEPNTTRIKSFTPVAEKAAAVAGVSNITVSYHSSIASDRRLVSDYAMEVIKIALKECNMSHAVITSTLRTPKDQARIMLENAKKGLAAQYKMYSSWGDKVLNLYESNKSKSDDDLRKLMEEKISEIMAAGYSVSNHCFTSEMYREKNVFDLGLAST